MKLTPLDIHHKEFRHSIRGYSEEEVDQFLDEVADEFERLFKENIELAERLEVLQTKVSEFEMQRQTINNTMMTAQRSADDIVVRANEEAEGIVAHANTRAKGIVNDALAKKQQVRGELLRIKQAEEEFRERYKALLESNLRSITEVAITDDVSALLGESGEVEEPTAVEEEPQAVAPVVAAPAGAASMFPQAPALDFAPPAPEELPAAPQLLATAVEAPEEESMSPAADVPPAASVFDLPVNIEAELAIEPPASGFVQAVTLGELDSPELPEDVELIEPSDFSLPRFEALGEREDDVDIEEID